MDDQRTRRDRIMGHIRAFLMDVEAVTDKVSYWVIRALSVLLFAVVLIRWFFEGFNAPLSETEWFLIGEH